MSEQDKKSRFKKGNLVSLAGSTIFIAVLAPVALTVLVIFTAVRVVHLVFGLLEAVTRAISGVIGAALHACRYDLRRNLDIVKGKNDICAICHQAEKGKEKVDLSPCCLRWVHQSCHELEYLKGGELLAEQMSKSLGIKVKLVR